MSLTGASATMLATLWGRALDHRAKRSILHDATADALVQRIDYDFAGTRMTATSAAGVALRAKTLDSWTAEFIRAHPTCTVLHLACGLDARAQRIQPPSTVRWLDVDMPDVVALRERLLGTLPGEPIACDHHTIAASVLEDAWLDAVPSDRPAVAVMEGLTMYLEESDGRRLVQRICARVPSGELLFDVYGTMGIKLQKLVPAVRRAGATLHWGVDDPKELEALHPGLRLVDALSSVDMPGLEDLPLAGRIQLAIIARIPQLRDVGRILRYRF